MIKDNIQKAEKYYNISENIKIGLEYIRNTDFESFENGRYEISDAVYANVQDYISKNDDEGKFEAHKQYIDIQYIVKGEEKIGVEGVENFSPITQYDKEKDIVFLSPYRDIKAQFILLKEKEFMILFPEDAHKPSIAIDSPAYVKKVVVKVRV